MNAQDAREMRRDKQQARCAEISTQRTMRNKAMARMTTRACRTAGSTELPRCYAGKGVKGRDAFNAVCGSSADTTRLVQDGDPIRRCPLLDECRHMTAFGGVCPTRSAFCVCLQPGLTKKCVEFGAQVCQVCVSFDDAVSTLCEIGHRSGCSKTPGTKT